MTTKTLTPGEDPIPVDDLAEPGTPLHAVLSEVLDTERGYWSDVRDDGHDEMNGVAEAISMLARRLEMEAHEAREHARDTIDSMARRIYREAMDGGDYPSALQALDIISRDPTP